MIAIDNDDNELIALEIIHRFVETLDKYFGNVCELDVVFNFDKVKWDIFCRLSTETNRCNLPTGRPTSFLMSSF